MGTTNDRKPRPWKCRDVTLTVGVRPLIMGVLNVTPDSFFDGGAHSGSEQALAQARQMIEAGADIVDVGGESTRPGASDVGAEDEIGRVVPVIEAIAREWDGVISVDTRKAAVAEAALAAGARLINDVSALTHDPDMTPLAARSGAGVVLMHMRGEPRTMQADPRYGDVVREVTAYLTARAADVERAGIDRDALALDPGIGFGKTLEHNLRLLANLDELGAHGFPVVVGLSRKSFLGKLTGRPVEERMAGSLAALVYCSMKGADVLRVHDVKESTDALKIVCAIKAAGAY